MPVLKPVLRQTKIKKYSEPVWEYVFPQGKYTKEDMRKAITDLKQRMNGRPGNNDIQVMSTIKVPVDNRKKIMKPTDVKAEIATNTKYGFRSAKWFNLNEDPILNDMYDFDNTDQFVLYMYKKPKAGGSDASNDCLFNSVMRSLNYNYDLIFSKRWKYPSDWKKRLYLNRYDKIDIKHIPQIEKHCKININIVGDHTYTSPMNHVTTVTISLKNGHYSPFDTREKTLLRGQHFKSKKLLIFESNSRIYNGKKVISMTKEEEEDVRINKHQSKYCFVHKSPGMEFEEQYKEIMQMKEAVKGVVDISKSGYSLKKAAVRLFHNLCKGVEKLDDMDLLEQVWINKAMLGALMFYDKCDLEKGYEYDINSNYPNILSNTKFALPIKKPTFHTVDTMKEFPSFGIYHCVIQPSGNRLKDRLFRFNAQHHYTHISVNHAKELGLEISLIQDGAANCMLYEKGSDRIYSSRLFKPFVDKLFPIYTELKDKGDEDCQYIKGLLNSLWGGLCEKNTLMKHTKQHDVEMQVGDLEIYSISREDNGEHFVKLLDTKKGLYMHNYARLGPFLLAYGRKSLCEVMLPLGEHVKRCHTDGFISDVKCLTLTVNKELGSFKCKEHSNIRIENLRKPQKIKVE